MVLLVWNITYARCVFGYYYGSAIRAAAWAIPAPMVGTSEGASVVAIRPPRKNVGAMEGTSLGASLTPGDTGQTDLLAMPTSD